MMELQIGRESGTESPRLAIVYDGKTNYYGQPGSVPKSVSRKHCLVTVGEDMSIFIEDVTSDNFMYINGIDCKEKNHIKFADTVELGPDRYRLDLESIVKAFSSKQEWHIGHLEEIFDEYQAEKTKMQVKQGKMNAASMLPGMISMVSMLLMIVWDSTTPRLILGTVAVVGMLFFFIYRNRSATSNPQKIKQLEDDFREHYVCPNPFCGHFLGTTPYKELLKNKACPYCKGKFVK